MLRTYEPGDLDDVLSAWESASRLAHPFLSDAFLAQERENIPKLYLPNAETWVWQSDDRVIGFIAMIENEIGGLFVDPDFHRKGIGRALLENVLDERDVIEVNVFVANSIGRAFYEKCGFTLLRPVEEQMDGCDLVRLQLSGLNRPLPHSAH